MQCLEKGGVTKLKIGLLTWYKNDNYGSALQAYSLHKILNRFGECDIVNYSGSHTPEKSIDFYLRQIYKIYERYIKRAQRKRFLGEIKLRNIKFQSFYSNNFTFTNKCVSYDDLHKLQSEYDAFICGSDQIWNPKFYSNINFLGFVDDSNRIIPYAPSIGVDSLLNLKSTSDIKKNLKRFKYLSVRENTGKKAIKELINRDAVVCCDPTILIGKKYWNNLIKYEQENEPYILCYFLADKKKYWRYVEKLKNELDIDIKVIPINQNDIDRNCDYLSEVGPFELLSYIKNAKYVCTDSFHGTIFSIMFETPFTVLKRFNDNSGYSQNSRVYDFLELTGMKNRLEIECDSNILFDIEWKDISNKIDAEISKSMNYLSKALLEVEEYIKND